MWKCILGTLYGFKMDGQFTNKTNNKIEDYNASKQVNLHTYINIYKPMSKNKRGGGETPYL